MMTNLKQKFRNCEFVTGMHTTLTDPCITELCGYIGFDFIWIDTEHTAIDLPQLQAHLIAARSAGVNSIVRIPWNDAVLAKRVLDMGPDGIIFPMVNTPEELDNAMKCTLYPPLGVRGFGPLRAVRYGLEDANEYISKGNLDMVRCVQIESVQAVKNLEEMAKNPYVDCYIIGPCDLSGSIGELNRVFDSNTQTLIRQAITVLKNAGKSIGLSTHSDDPEVLRFWYDMGINCISAGADYLHILNGSVKVLYYLKSLT
jgi:2-dehydro-3-deoxyglucarate aldolase/4-hydroxy-2-oxoheptanedioate aldolase